MEDEIKHCPNCGHTYTFNKQYGVLLELKDAKNGYWTKTCPVCGVNVFRNYFKTDREMYDLKKHVNTAISHENWQYLQGIHDAIGAFRLMLYSKNDDKYPPYIYREDVNELDRLEDFLATREYLDFYDHHGDGLIWSDKSPEELDPIIDVKKLVEKIQPAACDIYSDQNRKYHGLPISIILEEATKAIETGDFGDRKNPLDVLRKLIEKKSKKGGTAVP